MLTPSDFSKKQIAVVFCNEGEKMSLSNSNFVVKGSDEKIKFQCSCYRVFLIYAIGHCSITTPLIQAAKKFGFYFALMSAGFRLYNVIGAEKNGNTTQSCAAMDLMSAVIPARKLFNNPY